jgi:hypothetical protein
VRAKLAGNEEPLTGTFAGFRDHQNLIWLTIRERERAFKCDGGNYLKFKQICLSAKNGAVSGTYRPSVDGKGAGLLTALQAA